MTIKGRAHFSATTELMELMAIASMLALVTDFFWCIYEMVHGEVTVPLMIIATFLMLSGVIMGVASWRYHMRSVKTFLKTQYQEKMARRALLNRHYNRK